MNISIIIPVLNDEVALATLLPAIVPSGAEIIVVDGGSDEVPHLLVDQHGAKIISSSPGRALQMNAGAKTATGDVLLFLHADSELPFSFDDEITAGIAADHDWGRFDIRLSGSHPMLRVVEWMMNWRSRLTGICTGDQGLFVKKQVFDEMGGYAEIPLMEDVEFTSRLKTSPYCIKQKLTTSSRRWEQNGVFKTIWLMWSMRLRYFFGASPHTLVKEYYGKNS